MITRNDFKSLQAVSESSIDLISIALEMEETARAECDLLREEIIKSKQCYGLIRKNIKLLVDQNNDGRYNLEIYCYKNLLKDANDATIKLNGNLVKAEKQLEDYRKIVVQLNEQRKKTAGLVAFPHSNPIK